MPVQFTSFSPLTVAEAKDHLRVDGSLEDAGIELKLAAAVDAVAAYVGPLLETECQYSVERFEAGHSLYLPARKVSEIVSVVYRPEGAAAVTMSSSLYRLDAFGAGQFPGHPRLVPTSAWPTEKLQAGASVTVQFRGGWPTSADVPPAIKNAILLELGNIYRNRESIVMEGQVPRELDRGVRHLLMPYKLEYLGWVDERRTS